MELFKLHFGMRHADSLTPFRKGAFFTICPEKRPHRRSILKREFLRKMIYMSYLLLIHWARMEEKAVGVTVGNSRWENEAWSWLDSHPTSWDLVQLIPVRPLQHAMWINSKVSSKQPLAAEPQQADAHWDKQTATLCFQLVGSITGRL